MNSTYQLIKNGNIITPEGIRQSSDISVKDGTIEAIGKNLPVTGRKVIDARGHFVIPGVTEIHIHGCGRWGFENIDLNGFTAAADFLLKKGITSIVPTFQWDRRAVKNITEIITAYNSSSRKNGNRIKIPGIYIEGPFINQAKKGGIQNEAIATPSINLAKEIIKAGRGLIKIMTVAPELEGIEPVTEVLIQNGIIPAFGHSNSSLNKAEELYDYCTEMGVRPGMTHLFNASSPLSHREPGLAMLPFTRDIYFELNGDGVHIDSSMLKLISTTGMEERMMLISDALISAGLQAVSMNPEAPGPDIKFEYYGKEVVPTSRGVRLKESDILAGSAMLTDDVLRNYVKTTGTDLHRAIHSATAVPNAFLGTGRGVISPGMETDIIIVDENLNRLIL